MVFELKTRATSVLRYEIFNYIDYLDYEIVKYKGKHSSYERKLVNLILLFSSEFRVILIDFENNKRLRPIFIDSIEV